MAMGLLSILRFRWFRIVLLKFPRYLVDNEGMYAGLTWTLVEQWRVDDR